MKPLLALSLRLATCVCIAWLLWRWLGATGLAVSAPVFGVLLARPVLNGLEGSHWLAKALALRKINGRYFSFKGMAVDIEEDTGGHRWLQISDVRKVIPHLPHDRTLQALYGEGVRPFGGSGVLRIQAETLLKHLDQARDPLSLRFKVWLQRAVVHPAAGGRSMGLR